MGIAEATGVEPNKPFRPIQTLYQVVGFFWVGGQGLDRQLVGYRERSVDVLDCRSASPLSKAWRKV